MSRARSLKKAEREKQIRKWSNKGPVTREEDLDADRSWTDAKGSCRIKEKMVIKRFFEKRRRRRKRHGSGDCEGCGRE